MKTKLSDHEVRLDILMLKGCIERLEQQLKNLAASVVFIEDRVKELEAKVRLYAAHTHN